MTISYDRVGGKRNFKVTREQIKGLLPIGESLSDLQNGHSQ